MKAGTQVRVTNEHRVEYGQVGVVVGAYGITGIQVRLPDDARDQASLFVASELEEVRMKAGDRVRVVARTNQFFDRTGTIAREAFGQIFVLFDGEPAVSQLPFTEAQLDAIPDPRRGGRAIGRLKR